MRVEWHGQSAFSFEGDTRRVFIDPFEAAVFAGRDLQCDYPAIEAGAAATCCWSPTSTPTTTASRRWPRSRDDPARDRRSPRVAARRGDRGRLRARRGGRDRARPEHDLRLRARRAPRRPLRRLRPGGAAARAARGDRRGRPALPAGGRRPDDRRRAGGGDRARAGSGLGRADALPHRRGSASSRPRRSSWARWGRRRGSTCRPSRRGRWAADGPLVVIPAAP